MGSNSELDWPGHLVADPPVLLMDEPFGALDNVTRSKIHAEFKALDELKRKTIIMVTHDVQEAFELGDRICLMDNGKIIQNGTPADLLFKPKNSFVKGFLQEQSLQLEFKAIKLKDIWAHIVDAPQPREEKVKPLVIDIDLWTALEHVQLSSAKATHISVKRNDEIKTAGFEALMAAFYQYKKQQAK